MTAVAPQPSVIDAEALADDELRDLLAYPGGLRRPLLRANFIASIDGAVTLDGSGRRLGTATDRRVFTRLREVADVILVGAVTATATPYVDIRLSAEAQAWRTANGLTAELPVAVVSGTGAVPGHLLDDVDVPAAIRDALGRLGLHRVLVEGGPTLFSQLVSDNEIDELCLTTSPKVVAGPARRIAATETHVEIRMERRAILVGADGTVIVRWARTRP